MKGKKRNKLKAAILVVLIISLCAAAAVIIAKPRIGYMIKEIFPDVGLKKTLKETECETYSATLEELEEDGIEIGESLMLVNTQHKLDKDYQPQLCDYKDTDVLMNTQMAQAYAELSNAIAEKFDEKLYVTSTYRSYEEQQQVLEEEGSQTAQQPGASEHETGLAADIYFDGFAGEGVLNCEAGRFVNSNCGDYGFIIRYPLGKSKVTGISYEPWHIRYVGEPHSEIIEKCGVTLEEYIDFLEIGKLYGYDGSIITRQKNLPLQIPKNAESVEISVDGCGGYVITAKMPQ